MTLPRPYELEQGRLSPRTDAPPRQLDFERLFEKLIVVDQHHIGIAGCRLRAPEGQSAELVAERFRLVLAGRFLARRPHADEDTWDRFVSSLRALLCREREAGEEALSEALLLIDGL